MTALALAALLTGNPPYAATAAQPYSTQYVEKVLYQWVPVADASTYFGGMVASEYKGAQAAADLRSQVEALTKTVSDLAAAVSRQGETIESIKTYLAGEKPPAPPQPQPQPQPQPGPVVPPPPKPAGDEVPKLTGNALAVVVAKCAKCHESATASKGGGLALFQAPGTELPLTLAQANAIDATTYSGEMPKGGPPLSDQDQSAIRKWKADYDDQITAALKGPKP